MVRYLQRRKFLGTAFASVFLLTLLQIITQSLISIVIVDQDYLYSYNTTVPCSWPTESCEYHKLFSCTIKLYDKVCLLFVHVFRSSFFLVLRFSKILEMYFCCVRMMCTSGRKDQNSRSLHLNYPALPGKATSLSY